MIYSTIKYATYLTLKLSIYTAYLNITIRINEACNKDQLCIVYSVEGIIVVNVCS